MANDEIQRRLEEAFAASGLTQAAAEPGLRHRPEQYFALPERALQAQGRQAAAAGRRPVCDAGVAQRHGGERPGAVGPFTGGAGAGRTGRSALHRGARPRPPLISPRRRQRFFFSFSVSPGWPCTPRLLSGDCLLVEKTAEPKDGAIAVLVQDGALLVRTVSGETPCPPTRNIPPERWITPPASSAGR